MIDFRKRLAVIQTKKPTDPVALYDTLDRASDKGPLRPAQSAILKEWHETRRNEKDIILKLHTGQGKTLIGLLMLLSKLNELAEPAIYLCPNNFLIDQTCLQAKQFGIRHCTPNEDGSLPEDFLNGRSILITSVQKMFNGRTKFHLDAQSIPVSYVLMDDAHACIDTIREAFNIRLTSDTNCYQHLLQLFNQSLFDQGAGTFADIKSGNEDCLLPVPYWEWREHHAEVVKILSEAVKAESEKKTKASFWFVWPLLKDIIDQCQCIVSGHALEIAPYFAPLDKFGSFFRAKHRIFMSATVTNDAFLVKGLRLPVSVISNPLTYKEERWSGEKMVLIPSLIHDSLNRSLIVNDFGVPRKDLSFGVVALAPSFQMTADWSKCGAEVATKDTIYPLIDKLRQGQFDQPVVVVNRYDGIDLPDNMCRILVFDSMPHSESLIDSYEEDCRAASEITAIRAARTIEQGLGRSVRGEKDYCVIIITGSELVKFVRSQGSRRYLSNQTRMQIEIGLEIAEMAESESRRSEKPIEVVHSLINQSLLRDEGWKQYYIQQMDTVMPSATETAVLEIFKRELDAGILFEKGEIAQAVNVIQSLIDEHCKDAAEKGWYLQEMARMQFTSSKVESNRLQVVAHRSNRYLMKPRTGVEFTPLQIIEGKRVAAIAAWIAGQKTHEQLMLSIEDMLTRLHFGVKADRFEEAFKELGSALGFASERPDKEWKEGPDNLWCVRPGHYWLIECKSEVDPKRFEIYKEETGQMNNSCAWFDRNYKGATVVRTLIIPTNRLSHAAGFVPEVTIMKDKNLHDLRRRVKSFFMEFKTIDLTQIPENLIQQALETNHLTDDELLSLYADKVKQ